MVKDPSMGSLCKGNVCIVDHDLANRGFLRECLQDEGLSITTFNTGYEVKHYLPETRFQIFILNIDTPGVRDRELLRGIHQDSHSRVLLIVSERGDAFLKDAIDAGVYGFLYKPFDINEVCAMVNHLVR